MIREQNLKIIADAVAKVSDTMELKKGCNVIAKRKGNDYWYFELIAPNTGIGWWTGIAWNDTFPKLSKLTSFNEKQMQIIGREAQLADVLLAIGNKQVIYFKTLGDQLRLVMTEPHVLEWWDLRKGGIEHQSDKLVALVATLV